MGVGHVITMWMYMSLILVKFNQLALRLASSIEFKKEQSYNNIAKNLRLCVQARQNA